MIAEKSLNCSLISLPQINTNLPTCGPLEGLALMYILREQGALVTTNVTLSNRQVQLLQIKTFQVKGDTLYLIIGDGRAYWISLCFHYSYLLWVCYWVLC